MTDRAPVELRHAAQQIAARLASAGHQSYFAGGCVRDRLLGNAPEDIDIATAATPDQVRALFPHARGVGAAFGVMLVRQDGHDFEVATFRADLAYVDGRRPTDVRFASAEEDAKRRDFTINGLFEEPATGAIVDFVGGRADIEARVLRAIGAPDERFAEDHLRLLRAVRFAARFGFVIDGATASAMRATAPKLALIARERVGLEVRRMLEDASRVRAVALLEEFQLDGIALGESSQRSIGRRLIHLPEAIPPMAALAAWGLDRVGANLAATLEPKTLQRWREALVLSNHEENALRDALAVREGLRSFRVAAPHVRKRLAANPGWDAALMLVRSEDPSLEAEIAAWRATVTNADIQPPRLVTGDDLIRLGVKAGPVFRDVLEAVYDAQLDGAVTTQREALQLAEQMIRARSRQGRDSGKKA